MSTNPQFAPLPTPDTADGKSRTIGVEIEFIGLSAERAAATVVDLFGGAMRLLNPHRFMVEDSELGDFKVELDTGLIDARTDAAFEMQMREFAGDVAATVTPVEIVAPPLPLDKLPGLDAVIARLRDCGAQGTEGAALYGFGVHLNVELIAETASHILPVLTAFALLEDHIRAERRPDLSRRALPFVDPYPRAYLDLLAQPGYSPDIGQLIDDYLDHNPTRNRSLDMTPAFAKLDERRVRAVLGDGKLSPRPTYHYRLPDSRVGDPSWSLAEEWRVWSLIEHVAERPDLLEHLSTGWRNHRESWTTLRPDWRADVAGILARDGIDPHAITRR